MSILSANNQAQTTGRYIVTFRDGMTKEGLEILEDRAGIKALVNTADFEDSALEPSEVERAGGAVFDTLEMAILSTDEDHINYINDIAMSAGKDSAILDIEPEHILYAINDGLPTGYLRGYRDAVNHLYEKSYVAEAMEEQYMSNPCFIDDSANTWGVQAIQSAVSPYTGQGIKVAVLDTGMDLDHPDFKGRKIVSRSFVEGEGVQDGDGHGTHCIGTACGLKDRNGRRYGVACNSSIYVGKVLDNNGRGNTSYVLSGIEWALNKKCQVISMSLGISTTVISRAFENAGCQALKRGSLIVAAAGNDYPKTVGQPANSPSIMAVAAVDNCLNVASFSSGSGRACGANVDIAGPGVNVYSSYPMNKGRYRSWGWHR